MAFYCLLHNILQIAGLPDQPNPTFEASNPFFSVADRLPPAPDQPYIYYIFYIHIYLFMFLSQLQTDFHLLLISLVLCELLLSVYAIPADAIASAR